MRKTKEQKAITLIALIITIVVLLILAVVAINAVTGDGIIQHATNARSEYEEEQEEEQDVLLYYEQYLEAEGNAGAWIQEKTIIKNVKTGQVLEVGDIVDYKAIGTDYGDSETEKWAILGVEDGHLLLVSSTNILNEFTLSDTTDYYKGPEQLDKECEKYKNDIAVKARSIRIEDINKLTGYKPEVELYGKGTIEEYGNKVTYGFNGSTVSYSSSTKSSETSTYDSFTNVDGTVLNQGEEIILTTSAYVYDVTNLVNDEIFSMLFESTDSYWLASTYINTREGYAAFGTRVIYGPNITGDSLYHTSKGARKKSRGIRAVVHMNSDVQLTKVEDNKWAINS